MMMSRSGHTPEMDMSRTPQTPNSESCSHTNTIRSPANYAPDLRLIVELACSTTMVNLAEFVIYY